jgi:16S rRNA (guanine527-N7)-methyltransferase
VIPLLLARPDITAVAIESVGKKCAFMQKVRVEFGLESRFEVLSQRSEELGRVKGLRDGFDVVTARALAPLPTLLELCTPLLKPGGVFIAIKGASHVDELAQAKAAIHRLKLRHKVSHAYELPDKLRQTVLMLFEKTAPTPEAYPRRVGIPGKSPL